MTNRGFDIIIVGGGHAGIEAAHAAARLGVRTMLLTMDPGAVGRMSCNPAIGGLGKGHVVREIDALGGLMARATDATGIQFRTLNASKGPAVRAPRVQCDKVEYERWMQRTLAALPNLTIVGGTARAIRTIGGRIAGIELGDGTAVACRALVLTTGTFLDAVMHCGGDIVEGGRVGEPSARGLSESFLALGLETGRLKTGTPARLHRDSIDLTKCEPQPGDDPPSFCSFHTPPHAVDQVPCHLTRTNAQTHEIIAENIHRSPMFSGQITSVGPRYCPSIEDKIMRFRDKESHHLFLEPETRGGESIYPNGVSTSLPAEVQERFLRTVPGLENVRFLRYGYAVEYTFVPPHQLHPTLEVRTVPGLYLAGQINGTSGYEEAAGQGLIAGINAALAVRGEAPFTLGREEAYIGVMIDDLLTKDHREPYRLFTSRAEFRLLLRCDNADLRLAPRAAAIGLVDREWADRVEATRARIAERLRWFAETPIAGGGFVWSAAPQIERPTKDLSFAQFMARPELDIGTLRRLVPQIDEWKLDGREWELLETELKYAGYLRVQERLLERARENESVPLSGDFPYAECETLRHEARLALSRHRPATLGAASRLAGVTPADIAALTIELHKLGALRSPRGAH